MKKTTIAAALAFSLTSLGAVAGESMIPGVDNSVALVEMSDQELRTVEGTWRKRGYKRKGGGSKCFYCSNTAIVTQVNLSFASIGVAQQNQSIVNQSNN